jgi:hypothetical protein
MNSKLFAAALLLAAAAPALAGPGSNSDLNGNNGHNVAKLPGPNSWCFRVKDNDQPYRTPGQPCFNSDGAPGKANTSRPSNDDGGIGNNTADEAVLDALIYGASS